MWGIRANCSANWPAWKVHPHACGEYDIHRAGSQIDKGSSPRVWGIHLPSWCPIPGAWFIPTRVGNTRYGEKTAQPGKVHPHACGEYKIVERDESQKVGSSPRVWGILPSLLQSYPSQRFIPTRVGNTQSVPTVPCESPVHPHACGEYAMLSARFSLISGSSPRVWGIRIHISLPLFPLRFIPTRVGNTRFLSVMARSKSVHPHACGEYGIQCDATDDEIGSSPRVWGILGGLAIGLGRGRFIPTRVGNTEVRYKSVQRGSVHPHACGEYATVYV